MELKTSIPLLVVRQFGNATPLKTRYGGETGVVGPWWSGRPSRTPHFHFHLGKMVVNTLSDK